MLLWLWHSEELLWSSAIERKERKKGLSGVPLVPHLSLCLPKSIPKNKVVGHKVQVKQTLRLMAI